MIFLGDERYYSQMCFGLISRRWFEQKVAQWQEKNRRVSFYLKINIFVSTCIISTSSDLRNKTKIEIFLPRLKNFWVSVFFSYWNYRGCSKILKRFPKILKRNGISFFDCKFFGMDQTFSSIDLSFYFVHYQFFPIFMNYSCKEINLYWTISTQNKEFCFTSSMAMI